MHYIFIGVFAVKVTCYTHLITRLCSFFSPVDDSAILDCQFSDFYHAAPHGFEKILFEQQIF